MGCKGNHGQTLDLVADLLCHSALLLPKRGLPNATTGDDREIVAVDHRRLAEAP